MTQFLKTQALLEANRQNIFFKMLFRPLSWIYGLVVDTRNILYDLGIFKSCKLPAKITVAVGNLTVGGTGKTPFVIWLVRAVLEKKPHARILVLSRGFGSKLKSGDYAVYRNGSLTELYSRYFFDPMCDEARLISACCPGITVVAGVRRSWAYSTYIAESKWEVPDLIILDDGFQHRRIKRDINIVTLPESYPYGNGCLLPAGTLRENPFRAKKRIHARVVIASTPRAPGPADSKSELKNNFSLCRRYCNMKEAQEWMIEVGPVSPLLGIARPEAVLRNWIASGLNISSEHSFIVEDHQIFTESLRKQLLVANRAVLTTEKDYARNQRFFEELGLSYFVLKQELFEQGSDLKKWVEDEIGEKL